jgi:hypothetical protein
MIDYRYLIPKNDEQWLKEAEKAESAKQEMKINKKGQFKKGNRSGRKGRPKQYG